MLLPYRSLSLSQSILALENCTQIALYACSIWQICLKLLTFNEALLAGLPVLSVRALALTQVRDHSIQRNNWMVQMRPVLHLSATAAFLLFATCLGFGNGALAAEASDTAPQGFEPGSQTVLPPAPVEYDPPSQGNALPRPKRYHDFTILSVESDAEMLTTEGELALQTNALADTAVLRALGSRYVHIATGAVEQDKGGEPVGTDKLVRFFSYETGNTVDVIFGPDNNISSIVSRRGLQPPETEEEIRAAEAIVRNTSPSREDLVGLNVAGILTDPQVIGLGENQRVIYLTFNSENNEIAHVAWVNLTTQEIVREGPPPTER